MRSTIDSPLRDENVVMEVADPVPCIIVRAATGVSVVLPAVDAGERGSGSRATSGRSSTPWPLTGLAASTGADVDRERQAGHLFHLDFCDRADHVR